MSFRTASAILRGAFLIAPFYVQSHLSLIHGIATGQKVDFGLSEREEELKLEGVPVMKTYLHKSNVLAAYNVGYYTDFERIPEGSVAIVNLFGPVMKYGDMCSYGMVDKASLLQRIAASGKFTSVILDVDSPGGQADGTQLLADTIKNLRIPVIAVVNDGMMASAAMWIGSACKAIYATKQTDTFGSIGVFCTLADMKAYFEAQGLKIHEIYADQSTDKNKSYRDAMAGNYDLKKAELNFLRDAFANAITENRGDRLDTSKENPFTGKMYTAQEATDIGLIDGIKSFEEILAGAIDMGADAMTSTFNDDTDMKNPFKDNFSALTAMVGVAAGNITSEMVASVNKQIEAQGIPGVTLVLDTDIDEMSSAADKVTELEGQVATHEATIQTHLATIADLNKKLGAPAEEPTSVKASVTETIPGTKVDAGYEKTSVDVEKERLQAQWG